MVMEGNLIWVVNITIQYTDYVFQNHTLETYIILLTSVTPITSIFFKKMIVTYLYCGTHPITFLFVMLSFLFIFRHSNVDIVLFHCNLNLHFLFFSFEYFLLLFKQSCLHFHLPPQPQTSPLPTLDLTPFCFCPCVPVSYTHLTLPTTGSLCRSRWSPYH